MQQYDKMNLLGDTFYPGKPKAAELTDPALHIRMLQQDLNRAERALSVVTTERNELKSKAAKLERENAKLKQLAKDSWDGWNSLMLIVNDPVYLANRLKWLQKGAGK